MTIMMGRDPKITYWPAPRVPQWQRDVPAEDIPFIKTIIERPDDDGPRLVYADHLEETGRCEKAEFIRLQIKWFAIREIENCQRPQSCPCLRCRKAREWRADRKRMKEIIKPSDVSIHRHERGFVTRIRCEYAGWIAKGPQIIDKHPLINWVEIADRQPVHDRFVYQMPSCPEFWAFAPSSRSKSRLVMQTSIRAIEWAKAEAEKLPS